MDVAKKSMRKEVQQRIAKMSHSEIMQQSRSIVNKLFLSERYKNSKSVAVFVSMPKEPHTSPILKDLLQSENICYVPKVQESGLKMMRVYSLQDFDSFPIVEFSKFSLIEPPLEYNGRPREEALENRQLDLVLVPGVAFDSSGARLGHGKGYYDNFLSKCEEVAKSKGLKMPYTISIAFHQQKVDSVPMSSKDRRMDEVIFGET